MYRGHLNIWGIPGMGVSECIGTSKCPWGIKTYGGIKRYGASEYIRASKCMGRIQRYWGNLNVWGHPNIWGAYRHPLNLTAQCLLLICALNTPNLLLFLGGHPDILGASKCMGGVKTYGGIQDFKGCYKVVYLVQLLTSS